MLFSIWNHISAIGIKKDYDERVIKRVKLTNQFSLIAIFLFGFSGLQNYLIGDIYSALIIESGIVICLIGFYLNKIHKHRFSTFFIITIFSLLTFYLDSYSGLSAAVYLFYFPIIMGIVFIFDLKEDIKIIIFHLALIVILIIINILTHYNLFKSNHLTEQDQFEMFVFNILFSIALTSFFVYLTIQNNLNQSDSYRRQIADREKSEAIIKLSLEEKDVLMSELNHRVKNNLAIISGLFSLKLNDDIHEDAKKVLIDSKNRIQSMALIHNLLYNDHQVMNVGFEDYINQLIKEINSSYPSISNSIKVTSQINQIFLSIKTAIPCGLILNELLTNCYKHAFKGRTEGKISISITYKNDQFELYVKDDGVGIPSDYNKKKSLGVTVIKALTEQLDGVSKFTNDGGTLFELSFKNNANYSI